MRTPRFAELASILKRGLNSGEIEGILDLFPEAVIVVDSDLKNVTMSNAKATELTAFTRKELSEKNLSALFPNLTETGIDNSYQNPEKLETILVQRSGIPIVVEMEINPLGGQNNRQLLSFVKDTTIQSQEVDQELSGQRWEALKILAEIPQIADSDQAYQKLLQAGQLLTGASTAAIYDLCHDERKLKICSIWGNNTILPKFLPLAEIEHLKIPYIWEPGKKSNSELHRIALAAKIKYIATIPLIENDPRLGILVISDQIKNPTQELPNQMQLVVSTFASFQNIKSMLENAEKKLDEQAEIINISQALKDVINDGLLFVTTDLKIISINTTAELALGYSLNEVKGQPIQNILIGSKSLLEKLKHITFSKGEIKELGDLKLHRRDGQTILANIRVMPIMADGKTKELVFLISDLSLHEEYKARAKQLEQQALLGEVTAIFAHEVRNPINNISTGLQLMAMKFPEDAPIQDQINRLKQDCDRLEALMKSVLSFSRTKEYKMEPIDIVGLINSILDRWLPRITKDKIEIRVQPDNVDSVVNGDKRALEQVFTNLISNALNAMKEMVVVYLQSK